MEYSLINELGTNFIEYAAAVNTDRAIPDARSGLKPVARRILWGSFDGGRLSSKPHVKSARVVGDVMGALHPHGDSSIYGAMIRLSQPWVMRYPLIDIHGSNGSINGDGPAAMRYTEARLSKLSEDGLLQGIKKENVEFISNYDETCMEPTTLPAIFPNLLCNPNEGIGVAIACSWAPHNLKEVSTAIFDYLDGKEPILPGPDFPTGGVVINKNDLPNIIKTGRGTVHIRGKYEIKGKNIIFTEIPYGTTIESILDSISAACEKEEIDGIDEILDETSKKGVRIVISCNGNPNVVVNKLFAKTNLQSSFSYNQVALVDKTPTELGLADCIKIYIQHNLDCIVKEYTFDLNKTENKLEIVNGLLKALEDIDNIITLIKKSSSSNEARENLIKKYSFTENQAKAIVDMKLGRLAGLERIELQNEKADLDKKYAEIKKVLSSQTEQIEVIKSRLSQLVKTYGDDRRTELTHTILTTKEEKEIEFIEPEKCVVVMTESGYIKRVPITSFRTQKPNGKGIKTQDDITTDVIRTNTVDSLMIFTNKGKMYRLLVDNIPEGTNVSKGVLVRNLVGMDADEDPQVIYSIYKDNEAKYVLFTTKNGLIKKTALDEYIKTRKKTGISAINLKDNDELVAVSLVTSEDLIILTKKGMSIKFNVDEVGATSRTTAGVKGIDLKDGDEVIDCVPIRDENDTLALFLEDGTGKKVRLTDFILQHRGGKGVMCFKPTITAKTPVMAASLVSDEDILLVCGNSASICVSAKDIPLLGRPSNGNKILKENKITSVSKV